MKSIRFNRYTLSFSVLLAALAVFSFLDLPFSQWIHHPQSTFGNFFALVGDAPLYILLSFLGFALFFCLQGSPWRPVALFPVLAGIFFGGFMFLDYLEDFPHIPWQTVFPVVGLWVLIGFLPAFFLRKSMGKEALSVLLALLCAIALSQVATQLLKPLIGRMRFRDMIAAGTMEGFTPWFIPHLRAAGETFKSFPSGHTAAGSVIFSLWHFPLLYPRLSRGARIFCRVFPPLYVLTVAFSRILIGAHFATDTIAAALIVLLCFYAGERIRRRALEKI